MKPTLVFVYNADSGRLNTLLDMAHKVLSPSTYSCQLCALSHSTFSMLPEWKAFLTSLPINTEFLHRDELCERYGMCDVALPAILLKREMQLQPWIAATEINDCQTLTALQTLLQSKLSALLSASSDPER